MQVEESGRIERAIQLIISGFFERGEKPSHFQAGLIDIRRLETLPIAPFVRMNSGRNPIAAKKFN